MMENIKLFITNEGQADIDFGKCGIVARLLKVDDLNKRLVVLAENKVMEINYEGREIREATLMDYTPEYHKRIASNSGKFVLKVDAYRTTLFTISNLITGATVRTEEIDMTYRSAGWQGALEHWLKLLDEIDMMEG